MNLSCPHLKKWLNSTLRKNLSMHSIYLKQTELTSQLLIKGTLVFYPR